MKFVLLICAAALAAHAETLAEILARMDTAARKFTNMTASVKNVEYIDVLHESTESTGTVRLKRSKNGLSALMEFGEPNHYFVHLSGHDVEIFKPKAGPCGTVEEYDMRKHSKSMEQFALLGFGTTAAELQKDYSIALGNAATIDGMPTTRIDLLPKTKDAKELIAKIEMWIKQGTGNPVREKVTRSSKDYNIYTYSNLLVNTDIPDSAFELKMPKCVKRVKAK